MRSIKALNFIRDHEWMDDELVMRAIYSDHAEEAVEIAERELRAELSKWHNPYEKDMTSDTVLVKYIRISKLDKAYYTIGWRDNLGHWICATELVNLPEFEIIGWREIIE